jgi:hypothetical protein
MFINATVTAKTHKGRLNMLFCPVMNLKSDFRSLYCDKYLVSPQNYAKEVLGRVVYRHAKWPLKVLGTMAPSYLQADYDFIDSVGRIRRFSEYEQTVREYFDHPMNRNNPLRQNLLLRISTVKMRRLVRDVLPSQARTGKKIPARPDDQQVGA